MNDKQELVRLLVTQMIRKKKNRNTKLTTFQKVDKK